jgi:hypothetical protein
VSESNCATARRRGVACDMLVCIQRKMIKRAFIGVCSVSKPAAAGYKGACCRPASHLWLCPYPLWLCACRSNSLLVCVRQLKLFCARALLATLQVMRLQC